MNTPNKVSLSRVFLSFCLSLSVALSSPVISTAQEESPSGGGVLFILDASGSMWGQIENKAKIVIAKEVLTGLIQELPDTVQAGVQVYGHRSKGDCDDIEKLSLVGQHDKATLIQKIQSIQPKGMTPITRSLEIAGDQLKENETETTLVLISDGKETCEGDPCSMAQQLRDQGIQVKVHVVGFDVTQEEGEQLVCIAKAGGGKYFNAENTTELRQALVEVRQELVAKVEAAPTPPPPPPPAAPPVEKVEAEPAPPPPPAAKPAGETGLKLQAVLTEGSQPLKKDLRYRVFAGQADLEGNREQVAHSTKPQPAFKLDAGEYVVEVTYGDVSTEVPVTIVEGETLEQTISLKAGILRLVAIATEGGPPLKKDLRYRIFPSQADVEGNREQVTHSNRPQPVFRLKAGDYLVRVTYGKATVETEVTVTAGEATEQTIALEAGLLRIAFVAVEGGKPLKKGLRTRIFAAQADMEGNREQVTSSNSANPSFRLKAGQYLLRIRYGRENVSTENTVEVTAGQATELTITLEAGSLRLSLIAEEGGQPLTKGKGVRYRVYEGQADLEGNHEEVTSSSNVAQPLFSLKAGQYLVRAQLGDRTAETSVTVTAGQLTEQTLALGQ